MCPCYQFFKEKFGINDIVEFSSGSHTIRKMKDIEMHVFLCPLHIKLRDFLAVISRWTWKRKVWFIAIINGLGMVTILCFLFCLFWMRIWYFSSFVFSESIPKVFLILKITLMGEQYFLKRRHTANENCWTSCQY